MKELLFACSGPGASTAIAANTEYAWQYALLDAGLVLVSIGLWENVSPLFSFPFVGLSRNPHPSRLDSQCIEW